MRFFDRFINLAKADAHGVLDSLEDPGLILKQCLRVAESEFAGTQSRLEELLSWSEQLARQRDAQAKQTGAIEEQIGLAMAEEQDDLARFSIRRLLAMQRKERELAEESRVAQEEIGELEQRIATQETELCELRRQVEIHLGRLRANETGCVASDAECEVSACIRDEEVELEFLRRRQESDDGRPTR